MQQISPRNEVGFIVSTSVDDLVHRQGLEIGHRLGLLAFRATQARPDTISRLLKSRHRRDFALRARSFEPRHSLTKQKQAPYGTCFCLVHRQGLEIGHRHGLLAFRATQARPDTISRLLKSRHRRDFTLRARSFEPLHSLTKQKQAPFGTCFCLVHRQGLEPWTP